MIPVLEARKDLERAGELTPDALERAVFMSTGDEKKAKLAKMQAIMRQMQIKNGLVD